MTGTLRIVIAEDDALIAMYLEELLQLAGHEICAIAFTEAEAVAAALHHGPDLMIVDGTLGEGSGVAAMAAILRHQAVPHLYVTGDPQHILELVPGAVVLTKPFSLQSLAQGIERVLRAADSD